MVTSKIPQVLPPGTTHFCPAFGRYPNRAMKLKGCDEWAYWTGFDWHDGCRPPPSVRREMIDVRPKVTGPSIAELIEQGYLSSLPFKCTAAPVTPVWKGPEDGLPPVGLGVEVEALLPNHERPQWVVGRVAAHDTPVYMPVKVALVELVDPRAGHGLQYIFGEVENFRPIRTAEQLAAEQRKQQIEKMAAVISQGFREGKKLADVLYDAGARMPDAGAKP